MRSPSLYPVAEGIPVASDVQADLLLLTETGALIAALLYTDPNTTRASLLSGVATTDHWCTTVSYDQAEALHNRSRPEPECLFEAHREHFRSSSKCPRLPSSLCASHAVIAMIPHQCGAETDSLVDFLGARALPIICVEYQCFQSGADKLLLVTPRGEASFFPEDGSDGSATVDRAAFEALISTVCHEVNNPLGGILGLTELLRSRENLSDDVRQLLEEIESNATRVGDFTQMLARLRQVDEPRLVTVADTEMIALGD